MNALATSLLDHDADDREAILLYASLFSAVFTFILSVYNPTRQYDRMHFGWQSLQSEIYQYRTRVGCYASQSGQNMWSYQQQNLSAAPRTDCDEKISKLKEEAQELDVSKKKIDETNELDGLQQRRQALADLIYAANSAKSEAAAAALGRGKSQRSREGRVGGAATGDKLRFLGDLFHENKPQLPLEEEDPDSSSDARASIFDRRRSELAKAVRRIKQRVESGSRSVVQYKDLEQDFLLRMQDQNLERWATFTKETKRPRKFWSFGRPLSSAK